MRLSLTIVFCAFGCRSWESWGITAKLILVNVMLTVHMTITLLIEDSPYGFIAFLHANFPQRTCNPLRLRELVMQRRKLGKFRHLYRYKGRKKKWFSKEKSPFFTIRELRSLRYANATKTKTQKNDHEFTRMDTIIKIKTTTWNNIYRVWTKTEKTLFVELILHWEYCCYMHSPTCKYTSR